MDGIPLGDSYTWRQARDLGVTRRQVDADGVRLAQGLYLSSATPDTLTTRCRAWTRLLPPDAAFGLHTAALLLGAPLPAEPDDVFVVLRPRPVPPRRRGLQVRERAGLRGEDVVELDGLRVTSGEQTFLDLAPLLTPADLVAVGDALTRQGVLDAERLTVRLQRADGVRGLLRARDCAPLLDPRARSRPESQLRYWITTAGLPVPQPQVPVHDRWGNEVVHADLGYARWKIALEYEGRQHAEPDQFGRDIDRYSLMAADGWLVLRFAARHLHGPAVVVERTRRALLSRGWRPRSPEHQPTAG